MGWVLGWFEVWLGVGRVDALKVIDSASMTLMF